ncbi:hypothetical protein CBL_07020 [Carabus blaptoides fortunei]
MSRTDALQQILNEIIKIRPNTTIDMIKSKLNTLRTQFNKEMNHLRSKVGSSEASSQHVSLWCFKRMLFLKDYVLTKKYNTPIMIPEQEQQLPIKKEHSQESWVEFSDNLEHQYEQETIGYQEEELLSPTSSNESDPLKNNNKRKRSESDEDIPTIFSTKETEDKWDVFSKFITSEIRTIKSERRKKVIKRGIISLIFKHQEEEEQDEMN